ncbi:MAG: hypothetical protein ACTHQQ_18855, partial [Solirubrobacteraceae bacterium]
MTARAELRISVHKPPPHGPRHGDRVRVDPLPAVAAASNPERPARRHACIRRWPMFAVRCVVCCGLVSLSAGL